MAEPVSDVEGGCELRVWIVPGASRDEIVGLHGDRVKLRVTAPAESGRANEAVCDLLSGVIGNPVDLRAGTNSRTKTLFITGATADTVRGNLGL